MSESAALRPHFGLSGLLGPMQTKRPFGLSDAATQTVVRQDVEAEAETLTAPPIHHWRIPTFRGDMVIRAEASPAWFDGVLKSMLVLLRLDEGWDSYGARRIEPRAVLGGLDLLAAAMHEGVPIPLVVPAPRGGVQLEWHFPTGDAEVEILPDSTFSLYAEDERTAHVWEAKGDLSAVREQLADALTSLAR